MRFNTIARSMVAGAAALGLAALAAPKANADVTLTLIGSPVAVVGGFQYTYQVNLLTGTEISQGTVQTGPGGGQSLAQGFTMFDFFGLVGTPTFVGQGGANFAISTPAFGTQNPAFNDDASANIDAAYTGVPIAAAGSPVVLGNLLAVSSVNVVINGANPFSATSETTATQFAATNQGSADGPGVAPVPEASTVSMLALGMVGMVGVVVRRRIAK